MLTAFFNRDCFICLDRLICILTIVMRWHERVAGIVPFGMSVGFAGLYVARISDMAKFSESGTFGLRFFASNEHVKSRARARGCVRALRVVFVM